MHLRYFQEVCFVLLLIVGLSSLGYIYQMEQSTNMNIPVLKSQTPDLQEDTSSEITISELDCEREEGDKLVVLN